MKLITNLNEFYKTDEWKNLRGYLMQKRLNEQGELICVHCGKPIMKSYECIGHHKEELTLQNVNDANVSLNPDNIDLIHLKCHNEIHERFGFNKQKVYLVHGAICSGKTTFVEEQAGRNDIVVDIDKVWECLSNNPKYLKPNSLKKNVFSIYDKIIEDISHRLGKWSNCYVVTTNPYLMERKRLAEKLGAEIIHINTNKEECLKRLKENPNGRDVKEYTEYIETYFERFQADE